MQATETVVVVGGGIGGLTLAHGLRKAGVPVEVYERDRRPEDTGGYRLHLDGTATRTLSDALPRETMEALRASGSDPAGLRQFAVMDRRLRTAVRLRLERDDSTLVGRRPLRSLLARDLGDTVRWGTPAVSVETDGAAAVVRLSDGVVRRAGLVVAADGARSEVARDLFGRPTARRLRASGLAGRTPLDDATDAALPADLHRGLAFAAGPGRSLLFLSRHRAVDRGVVGAHVEPPKLLWGFTLLGTPPGDHDGACALARRWSAELAALVEAADPGSVGSYGYWSADPDRPMTDWPAGPVVPIGDAVHAVPPTGGRGAATAIRDAGVLVEELVSARDAGRTWVDAGERYRRRLATYAVEAVRESLAPLRAQRFLGPVTVAALGAVAGLRSR